jgi:hypothetical protein
MTAQDEPVTQYSNKYKPNTHTTSHYKARENDSTSGLLFVLPTDDSPITADEVVEKVTAYLDKAGLTDQWSVARTGSFYTLIDASDAVIEALKSMEGVKTSLEAKLEPTESRTASGILAAGKGGRRGSGMHEM